MTKPKLWDRALNNLTPLHILERTQSWYRTDNWFYRFRCRCLTKLPKEHQPVRYNLPPTRVDRWQQVCADSTKPISVWLRDFNLLIFVSCLLFLTLATHTRDLRSRFTCSCLLRSFPLGPRNSERSISEHAWFWSGGLLWLKLCY